ncbi:hypothetical protein [Sphingomonas morindae]|uniref:Uncharacterized protein n=1 Tax=Sphingomonas morindae TaxID=1541170 RepID=A0ABY4X521_9SPHN|nr:hypothetical protein [Sphingomonas morindae]USI71988.1 hypothetical protein LHA26_11780 [Sphingomonas morindae]
MRLLAASQQRVWRRHDDPSFGEPDSPSRPLPSLALPLILLFLFGSSVGGLLIAAFGLFAPAAP